MMLIVNFLKILKYKPLQMKLHQVMILLNIKSEFVLLISKTSPFSMTQQISYFDILYHLSYAGKNNYFYTIYLKVAIFGTLLLHYFQLTTAK